MSDQPDRLEKAYQEFKQRHPAPLNSRRAIMRAATGRQSSSFSWYHWGRTLVAGVAVVGISLFVLLNQQFSAPGVPVTLVSHVQLHGYNPDLPQITSHKQQHALYYQQYAKQTLALTQRYSQPATVLESNGELALTTCKDDVIKLSDSLVSRMLDEQRLSPALARGDAVAIRFNQDGYIVSIDRMPAPKQC